MQAFSRASPWKERWSAPASTAPKASAAAIHMIVRGDTGIVPGFGKSGSRSPMAAATSATPSTVFTVSIQAPERGSFNEVVPRTKKSSPIPSA